MKKLFWSHDPVMASVYASEDWVLRLRDTVGAALVRAVGPVQRYLDTLEPFVEFLNVDGKWRMDSLVPPRFAEEVIAILRPLSMQFLST